MPLGRAVGYLRIGWPQRINEPEVLAARVGAEIRLARRLRHSDVGLHSEITCVSCMPLFAFIFEAPLTAAAVAGGAVSIPIIIHLLNRRRFRIVTWAAMRFLLAAQQQELAGACAWNSSCCSPSAACMVLLLVLAMASVTWALGRGAVALARARCGRRPAGSAAHAQDPRPRRLVQHGLKDGDAHCFDRARAGRRRSSARVPAATASASS